MSWKNKQYWQKTLLDDLPRGGGNMKKYKILWGITLKFRSFVVVPAFFWKFRAGVCIVTECGDVKVKQRRI